MASKMNAPEIVANNASVLITVIHALKLALSLTDEMSGLNGVRKRKSEP